MDVLIIGGTRFVGYQLAWRLIAGGHGVTLLNRGSRPDPWGDRVERLVADRTTPRFAKVLQGHRFDAAIDFAAFTGDDTRSVVEVLGGRVHHYVLISTGQVYLVREGCRRPARELDYDGLVMRPPSDLADRDQWRYGVDKRAAEDVLAEAWARSGFPSTRLRIPMVNGERDHYRRLERYLWRILDGGPVILPDGGTHATRHVYSGSVVRAIVDILGREGTFGRAYNLAQQECPTLAELVAQLAELVGAPSRTVAIPSEDIRASGLDPAAISPFSANWMSFLDPSTAVAELGFRHEPLRSYLATIISSYLNHPTQPSPDWFEARAIETALAARA